MASWLDALQRRGLEAIGKPDVPQPASPRIARPSAPLEIKTVWVQTAPPSNGDAGAVEPGFYSIADGVVTMHDESGKPTGKTGLVGVGEDPRRVAHRLAREAWLANRGEGNFNRRIDYPRGNFA
ncbi:hypothetical protein [Bradyrhizobium lablabi]|uniref:hypothetical protein n=1 Tax=Bradyrhizobium lablabi TaxID=722472 RepID=UPI00090AC524|nr:hypothetical protein [Bradyrhizobium lablabi]SHM40833.1 hypothetical protein SAMN05444321_6244 [Bradyrhizobium lablabi]